MSAPAAAQEAVVDPPRFDVWEYRIEGNTLLDVQLVEKSLYPLLGADKTIDDVELARAALEKVYRDAGYPTVLVNIPEQSVEDGMVRLEVLEGRVDRLRITGSRYFSLARIREQVPSLAPGAIPDLASAQAQLNALNRRSADRSVMPVLRPGRTPGTVEVELRVKDQFPLHGSIEVNDRNSANTTHTRLSASLSYDNLWQREHSASLQYQTSPEDTSEVQVWVGSYVMRREGSGRVMALYGVHSDSDTAAVGTLGVLGKGNIFGVREIVPLPAGGERYVHNLTLGADYKRFRESIFLEDEDALDTPISYVPWTVQYGGTLHGAASRIQFGGGVNFGIRGLANDPEEFDLKRFDSKPNFIYLTASMDYSRDIVLGSSLRLRARGQLADSPLISNEQFSAGGADGVRGYHESQVLGDDGVSYSIEWHTPSFGAGFSSHVQDLRLLVFGDGASLRLRSPLPAQTAEFELYSAGAGLRMSALERLTLTLDWAYPLKDQGSVLKGDERVHASFRYAF